MHFSQQLKPKTEKKTDFKTLIGRQQIHKHTDRLPKLIELFNVDS
jgi:hypothetical protein